MEQIARQLFAVTAVSIFCYVIIFAFIDSAGNGGEYWGYDGQTEPRIVARRSYESEEFVLLAYVLSAPDRGASTICPGHDPMSEPCWNKNDNRQD